MLILVSYVNFVKSKFAKYYVKLIPVKYEPSLAYLIILEPGLPKINFFHCLNL